MRDSDKKDKKGQPLSAEDKAAWAAYTRDMSPEERADESVVENFEALLKSHEAGADLEDLVERQIVDELNEFEVVAVQAKNEVRVPSVQEPQVDKRTMEKLRKGKMPIEARIDLHGMTREVAYRQLENFIMRCAQDGLRHVLVITGKGKSKATSEDWLTPSKGVLKTNVPIWLEGVTLKPYVLKYVYAKPKDGGTGALYVYLRRKRS